MDRRYVAWICVSCAILVARMTADAQEMLQAIKTGDVQSVRRLLDLDPGFVNRPGSGGLTPLHIAVNWEQPQVVKELLARGADPLIPDNDDRTPLYWATKGKNAEIRRLLEAAAAAKARTQSPGGSTPPLAGSLPSSRPTSQPADIWTWLLNGNKAAPASPGGTFVLDRHNYRLRQPERPWVRLNPATLNAEASYAATRADLRTQFIIISEEIALTQDAYVDLVVANFESRVSSARRISSRPRQLNGMAGTEVLHTFKPGAIAYVRLGWYYVHNGLAYQLLFVGPAGSRDQIEKAGEGVLAGFSLIDPSRERIARRMPRFISELGFTVDVADNDWEPLGQSDLIRQRSTFVARHGNDLELYVMVASLAGCTAELPEIATAMTHVAGLSVAPDARFTPLKTPAGADGVDFETKWASGGTTGPVEARLLHRGDLVYLIWAATNEAHRHIKLARILDYVQLTPNAPPALVPQRMPPQHCKTVGFFLNDMGIQRLQGQNPSSSAAFFEAARRFVPDDWVLFTNYIEAMMKAGNTRAALAIVNRELDHFKRTPDILLLKATLEYTSGDRTQARQTYAELFKSGYENDTQFRIYLGLLTKDQMDDQAIAAADEYLRRFNSVGATLILSELLAARGSHDRALKLLQDRQAGIPFNSTLAVAMAEIHQLTGEFTRTQELVQQLLDAGNNSSRTFVLKGRAELGLKLHRQAKESFEKALRTSPGDAIAAEWLASVSRVLGEGDNSTIKQLIPPVELPAALLTIPDPGRIAALSSGHSACNLIRATAIAFEPEKSMTTTQYRTVKILDNHGVEQFKLIKERFDPLYERIHVNRLIVHDEQGRTIAQGRPADYYVQDDSEAATSWRVLHIPVPGIRPGCVIEMVTTRCEEPAPKTFKFDDHLFLSGHPAEQMIVALKAPGNLVNWHGMRLPPPTEVDGFRVWSLPPVVWRSEPLQAHVEDYVPCLMIADRALTWQSVATEYRRTIEERLKPEPAAADLAKSLTAGAPDDDARVRLLVRKLQKDFTYKAIAFGRRARIPQPAPDIIRNSYGDCKDHSLLLMQMLNALGIEAHLALIRSSGPFLPELPTLDQFDHMIVYVPLRNAFFDATDKWGDLTSGIPWSLAGRTALVLDPKNPRLMTIAPPPADSGRVEVNRIAGFEQGTNLLIRETDRLTGIFASEFRALLQATEPRERPRFVERLLNETGLSGHIRQFSVKGLETPDQPLVIELEYIALRAFRRLNGQLVGAVPCPIERYFYAATIVDHRETPFRLEYPTSLSTAVELELPPDFRFVGTPLGASAVAPDTHGQAAHSVTGRILRSTLSLANDRISRPPETYDAFVRARQDILNGLEAGIAVEPARK